MFFFFKFLIQIICQLNIMCVFICINSLTLYFILNFVYKTICYDITWFWFDLCENFIEGTKESQLIMNKFLANFGNELFDKEKKGNNHNS